MSKTTTQTTTKMRNTDPTKNHNTENYKDEKHGPHQKPQNRKLQRWETRTPPKPTTQTTTKMRNTNPNKNRTLTANIIFKCTSFSNRKKKVQSKPLESLFFLICLEASAFKTCIHPSSYVFHFSHCILENKK
jgi:hypothetical protein